MKKIFVVLLICTFLTFAFSVTTFAEETTPAEEIEIEEIETEEVSESFDISIDDIISYVKEHYEEISVILGLIVSALYSLRLNKKTANSITTVNNNAVAIAENSASSMAAMSGVVEQYQTQMEAMLDEIRRNDKERADLEESLAEVTKYLKATRLANVELANEVAELLILANIPNSKKDELYARHLAAVNEIALAEAEAAESICEEIEGVKENEETHEE